MADKCIQRQHDISNPLTRSPDAFLSYSHTSHSGYVQLDPQIGKTVEAFPMVSKGAPPSRLQRLGASCTQVLGDLPTMQNSDRGHEFVPQHQLSDDPVYSAQNDTWEGSSLNLSALGAADEVMFMEEFLLPESNFNNLDSDLVTLRKTNEERSNTSIGWQDTASDLLQNRGTRYSNHSSSEKHPTPVPEVSYARALHISAEDLNVFSAKVRAIDAFGTITSFPIPRRPRIVRALTAYFEYFDPHAPFVQHATFNLRETHPALILAMIAIGSLHLFERDFSHSAYEAACKLLQHYNDVGERALEVTKFEFWPIQATLLCVQFGAFSSNEALLYRSQAQFSSVLAMLRGGLDVVDEKRQVHNQDWETWSFLETFTRLACWTGTLSAIILALDPNSTFICPHQICDLPMPREELYWRAGSEAAWLSQGGNLIRHNTPGLARLAKAVLRGESITDRLSSYGLLCLIGWILGFICNHERLSMGVFASFDPNFTLKMEKALATWEGLFRAHPHANQVSYKQADPLLADCFSLLGSAYYHLFLGRDLQILKILASEDNPRDDELCSLPSGNLRSRPNAQKAVRYAANSWLVRAKMGIAQLHRTAGLTFGGQYFVTAYESGKSATPQNG